MHVIVHAGYHKTGTTSLQDFLHDNAALLAPHLRYFGKADFRSAGAHARIYAQRPYPWRLWRFRRSLRRFLADLPPGGTVVLSRETFSGGMPGHRRFGGALMTSYAPAARKLAKVIIAELRRAFGPQVKITFFYTTRATEPWIRSVYGHLLRSIRLRDDFDTFRARFPNLAGPAEEAADMARYLAPIPVITAAHPARSARPPAPRPARKCRPIRRPARGLSGAEPAEPVARRSEGRQGKTDPRRGAETMTPPKTPHAIVKRHAFVQQGPRTSTRRT